MTIVYCTDTLYRSGGIERVLTRKANYLADICGYKVYIATFHQKGRKPFFRLSDNVRHVDLGVNIRLPFTGRSYRTKLVNLLDSVDADVCISMCGKEFANVSKIKYNCLKIAEFHFSYQSFYIRGKQHRLPSFIRYARRMDKFVVLTKEDAAKWEQYIDNVIQIYNPSIEPVDCLSDVHEKKCISGGRLVKQKNYGAMLEVWRKVSPLHPDWKLDIFGTGPLHDSLKKSIVRYGLSDSVTIHPPVGNFLDEIRKSSIYLMTSTYEGFPMTLIEAAAVGVPSVAFKCPTGPAEIIIDGETGYTIQSDDTTSMAQRLDEIMTDMEKASQMGLEAQRQSNNFRIKEIMKQWISLFETAKKE